MKILVTGSDGYIGSVLTPLLMQRGHRVVGLDAAFYRSGWLYNHCFDFPPCINKDVRNVDEKDLLGFDAVVHLAELSNDPLGQIRPGLTYSINHRSSVSLARRAKNAGIKRFVYSSSCSVYGAGNDDFKTEESAPNPQTAYAECKALVERDISELAGESFSPTCLRNATAYGPSPRMRFDTVLNNLAGFAWTTGEIRMTSDGTPWRPLVHVRDICEAMARTLEAPRELIHNQIFNVGDTEQNYRVREIAEVVAAAFTGCSLVFGSNSQDRRSYRVSFVKVSRALPGFRCRRDAVTGAHQLREMFQRIGLERETFEFPAFTRVKEIRRLINSGQLDPDLVWCGDMSFGEIGVDDSAERRGRQAERKQVS